MSSISSRFSTLTSASAKSYQPPKPSYQSPKLVQRPQSAKTLPQDLSRITHPFANPTYVTPRCAPSPPDQQNSSPVSQRAPSQCPSISEFGSIHSDFDPATSAERPASAGAYDSVILPPTRERSNTVGSVRPACPEYFPPTDFLPSPNPFKSQFDDSDDEEEKLDFAIQSLAGVSNRARLAAIGTASRLFKGKRHSRTSSKASPLDHDLPPHLLDNRVSQARSPPAARPCTSDGMSPNPRQAMFGHRPSPSELSFPTKRDRSRSVTPADRDLILALQGGGPKLRSKQTDKKKSPPKLQDQHRSSHTRQTSVTISPPIPDSRSHWAMDPPPYCAPSEPDIARGDSLRKSQSLSTLRFGFNHMPNGGSCAPFPAASQKTPEEEPPARTSEQPGWETTLTTSPSSISDHGSAGGGARRAEASPQTPSKRLAKANRLPPQKPPPQFCLPLPPPPPPAPVQQAAAAKCCSDEDVACPSSADESVPGKKSESKIYTHHNTAQTSLDTFDIFDISSDAKPPSPPPKSTPQLNHSRFPLDNGSQVILDVGGTKFVTLISTLQGAPGDQPWLLDLLQQDGDDAALCSDTQLTRRRRVETSHRHRFDGETAARRSPLQEAASTSSTASTSSSGTCSPPHTTTSSSTCSTPSDPASSLFVDRNADLYRDILDILRTRKLPYRLQASCLAPHSTESMLRLQLRCRLWEVKDEASWLGYTSVVALCEREIAQI